MNVSTNEEKKWQLFSSTHILYLFISLFAVLESDKDYNKTSQIKNIFPITLRLSRKVNFWV